MTFFLVLWTMIQVWHGTAVLCVTSSAMNVPVNYMYNTGFLSLAYFFCITRLLIANEQPCEGARLWGDSLTEPCAIVPGAEKVSNRCNSNVTQHLWHNAEQRMHCFWANMWYRIHKPSCLQPTGGWIFICIKGDSCRICLLEFFIGCCKGKQRGKIYCIFEVK